MFLSLILFTACKVDRPEKTTVSADVQTAARQKPQNQPKTEMEQPSPSTDGMANVNIGSDSVQIQLPSLTPQSGSGRYCYLQEMPTTLDVGMSGLKFKTDNQVDFVSIKGIRSDDTNAERGRWSDCSDFGRGSDAVPLYEVVGVDLAESNGALFDGFNWISLPENTAFSFPVTDLWIFEVQAPKDEQAKIDVLTTVSTIPKATVEAWAGVIEYKMGSFQKGTYESKCTFPNSLNILSIFGHSEPSIGTWDFSCGGKELFSVQSEKFTSDIPPLKNFTSPKSLEAGTDCTVACSWGDEKFGQMCEAIVVVTSIDAPMACIDGELR